jgi:hypothetical protein
MTAVWVIGGLVWLACLIAVIRWARSAPTYIGRDL